MASTVFVEADGGSIEINVTHKEARRLIAKYELDSRDDPDDTNPMGSWSKHGRGYLIHLRT